jgi:hypothetical protein
MGNIYFLANLKFYKMPVGTDELNPVNIEIPEGMDVFDYTFDGYGRMHLFIAEHDKKEYFIWRLDESYQVDKTIEISAYVEETAYYIPHWFLVLEDGTYYIQWPLEQNGIIVSSEGMLKHKFTLKSLGIGWVLQVAVGKDGHIYIVHRNDDNKPEIVKLDANKGVIDNENPALYFSDNELFYTMSGGTDTNLLLLSVYSGVWACDTESGVMENRVSSADISSGLDNDTDLWHKMILPDGRLFVIGKAANDGNAGNSASGNSKHLILKYIPAGK